MIIVICEDNIEHSDAITASIKRWQTQTKHQNIVVSAYNSSEDLFEAWQNGLHIDLLLLDIKIESEMSGMDLAKEIRKRDTLMIIAFITNFDTFAIEGYTVDALRYLKKPVNDPQMFECLSIAYERWYLRQGKSLVFGTKNQRYVMSYADIIYAEALSHSIKICSAGKTIPEIRHGFSDFVSKLPKGLFLRCHKSYVVNLMYVQSVLSLEIVMCNGERIPIGEKYAENCHDATDKYLQRVMQ